MRKTKEFTCRKCQSTDLFTKNNTETQIGLYCSDCRAWQKWLGKDELRVFEESLKAKQKREDRDEVLFILENELKQTFNCPPNSGYYTLPNGNTWTYDSVIKYIKENLR